MTTVTHQPNEYNICHRCDDGCTFDSPGLKPTRQMKGPVMSPGFLRATAKAEELDRHWFCRRLVATVLVVWTLLLPGVFLSSRALPAWAGHGLVPGSRVAAAPPQGAMEGVANAGALRVGLAPAWPWVFRQALPPDYGYLGGSVAVSADGHTAIAGSGYYSSRGLVEIFLLYGSTWRRQAVLGLGGDGAGSDFFGESLALSSNGKTAMIGAPGRTVDGRKSAGAAEVYRLRGRRWTRPRELNLGARAQGGDGLGASVALSANGSTAVVGAWGRTVNGISDAGALYVFRYHRGIWSPAVELSLGGQAADGDELGSSLAISASGRVILAGESDQFATAANPTEAVAFRMDNARWSEPVELRFGAAYDAFGTSTALSADGNTALVGAPGKIRRRRRG